MNGNEFQYSRLLSSKILRCWQDVWFDEWRDLNWAPRPKTCVQISAVSRSSECCTGYRNRLPPNVLLHVCLYAFNVVSVNVNPQVDHRRRVSRGISDWPIGISKRPPVGAAQHRTPPQPLYQNICNCMINCFPKTTTFTHAKRKYQRIYFRSKYILDHDQIICSIYFALQVAKSFFAKY